MENTGVDPAAAAPQAGDGVAAAAANGKAAADSYVAVVFFHGIGQQRNFEMTTRLVESLDDWAFSNYRARKVGFGIPRLKTITRPERVRGGDDPCDAIVYQQADYSPFKDESKRLRVRFYEGYWAPATVDGASALGAFGWIMRQLLRPIAVLRTPWRSYARLRRAELLRFARHETARQPEQPAMPGAAPRRKRPDFKILLNLYRQFVYEPRSNRNTFAEYLRFIKHQVRNNALAEQLVRGARRWRRRHVAHELALLATFTLLALSIIAGFVLIVAGLLRAIEWFGGFTVATRLFSDSALEPNVMNGIALLSLILGASGIAKYFRNYVGDIQQFVTFEETQPLYERRRRILEMAEKTLRHVLTDPRCERVVMVAHSLGTAIALDAILRLRSSNLADKPTANADEVMRGPLPLGRIQHFITCGSPIDKINYFFAALRSPTRTYESLVEALRGDISSAPFSKSGGQPYVHWINFWDRGDPISGPIETVTGSVVRDQRVDNVQLASFLWPDPAASHDGYFRHREFVGTVFDAAFNNGLSFANAKGADNKPPVRPWLGPGSGPWLQGALLLLGPLLALMLVWTALSVFFREFPRAPYTAFAIVLVVHVAMVQVQKRLRLHRAPIN